MRWVTNSQQNEYMRQRQRQNKAKYVPAEEWAWGQIKGRAGKKWSRQAMWGCRIFDFWCAELGIAVEIDGDTHDPEYDQVRDRYNYYRSGILVLRVKNFDENDLALALAVIDRAETKKERVRAIKRRAGLTDGHPQKHVLKALGIPKAHGDWQPRRLN